MPAKTLLAVTLAFAAAAPALAQESLPTFRASVRTDANFPNPAERGLPTGVFQVGATQDLTVLTPAGVREPANRRVNVMLGM